MGLLRGTVVELQIRTQTGVDAFNAPIYSSEWEDVENVLISPVQGSEITDTQDLTGRKAVYQLGIPKTDTHKWENCLVRFFGETWRVIGKPVRGLEHMIPLDWNMKVEVESIGSENQV